MANYNDKLVAIAGRLSNEERDKLLEFAEFLESRSSHATSPPQAQVPQSPLDIPRPDEESVIAAMQRLAKTYPMLNKDKLLHEAAGLMSEHVMHGRDAAEVIDDLEALFVRHYELYSNGE
ncbi:MAG: Crp/Fnr family transcriptional regulator [Granulosicoccaceae bacterium]